MPLTGPSRRLSITAAMCAAGRVVGDPRLSPDGSLVGFVSTSDGQGRLVVVDAGGGPELVVATEPPIRGSAAYGSGVWDWVPGGREVVYVATDGNLYAQSVDGGPSRPVTKSAASALASAPDSEPAVTPAPASRTASPAVSPDGTRVAYTVDDRDVVVTWLDGSGRNPQVVSDGADFCVDPAWSPDGRRVAWHEWRVPAMPWDHSAVAWSPAPGSSSGDRDLGVASPVRRVPIGLPAAVGQPRFAPSGASPASREEFLSVVDENASRLVQDGSSEGTWSDRLGFLCDAGGWLNLWVADVAADAESTDVAGDEESAEAGEGRCRGRPLVEEPYEHGGPTWGGGQRSWVWSPDGARVAFTRNEGGFGRLCLASASGPTELGEVIEVDRGVFYSLSWRGRRLAALRTGGRTPDQVVVYDMDPIEGGERPSRRSLARGPVAGFEAALAEPEIVHWESVTAPGAGTKVHGRLYRAVRSERDGAAPLLVWVHGGPTGQQMVAFNARLAYFLDRGWNVLQPDFRGSTGWGRGYTQALAGGWGYLDTEDIAAAIRAAAVQGWGDPSRVAIMGASSGGLSVLSVLAAHPGLCAAGVDLYGVTDLLDLAGSTNRFEAHYQESLVGPLPAASAQYRERSPIYAIDRITAPVLVFHGDADRTVPLAQSERLVAALQLQGTPVEFHVYPGEGHGWARAETVLDELDRIDRFLGEFVLGAVTGGGAPR